MTQVGNGSDYESCKNMIWKMALDRYNCNRRKRPDVDFDDVLSEAFCVYGTCLSTYKSNKGMKFTTYLYQNLRARLRDFYRCAQKEIVHYEDYNFNGKDGSVVRFEEGIVSHNYELDEQTSELMSEAKNELSYEGFVVFKYIVNREWESKNRRSFPMESTMARHFGYSLQIMQSIMSEIRNFWNSKGWLVA